MKDLQQSTGNQSGLTRMNFIGKSQLSLIFKKTDFNKSRTRPKNGHEYNSHVSAQVNLNFCSYNKRTHCKYGLANCQHILYMFSVLSITEQLPPVENAFNLPIF